MRLAGGDGQLQGFFVHVALHEQFATVVVRGNDGYQAAVVELGREVVAFLDLFDRLAGLKIGRERQTSCFSN